MKTETKPVVLYHGTSESRAMKILRDGISPRHVTGKSNWEHSIESNPEAVYLTDAYPLYFGCQASKDNERWAVVEVDVDTLDVENLHPDEDAWEQAGRTQDGLPKSWDMNRRTRHYRKLAINNPNWLPSLRAMGTCAHYGKIPATAITRVALFDSSKYDPGFILSLTDCTITLLNYKFCGEMYKARTKWIMGESVTAQEVYGFNIPNDPVWEQSRPFWEKQVNNRSGIEIINAKGTLATKIAS